jgi:hypothetical protein
VLTGNASAVHWVGASNGAIPAGAVAGGSEPGRTLYICRARYNNGLHPGKVVAQNCNIGWGGKEILVRSYEVMVASSGGSQALTSAYQQAKASNAQPDSAQRFALQGSILTNLTNAVNALPGGSKQQLQAAYNKPLNVNGGLDVKFLTDRYNEANTQIGKMVALQKDPASPCGKAIQQAGVTPTKPSGPAPRGLASVFATSAFANAAVQAAQKLQAAQQTAAKQHAETLRRAQLVAFADMLKKREAAAKAAADQAARIHAATLKVVPAAIVAKPADVQAVAAAAQAAAARIAKVAQRPQIRALSAPPAKPGAPAARALPARTAATRTRVLYPGGALTPQARQAFAAAFARDAREKTQTGINAVKQREQQLAQLRAALIAKRQAEMARRIAAIPGVSDQEKQAFAKAFAAARPADRAKMIKELPVSRQSSVPGTPFATRQANAQAVVPAKEADMVEVNANILQAMRRLAH